MDREPFARWDILADETPPYDVLTLVQKSQFNAELIRAYAQRQRAQNLLLQELTRLLEPSSEFTKLAIANIETRNLTQAVVETWKPIVASAVKEWAKQRTLTSVLAAPAPAPSSPDVKEAAKVETTADELAAFETIRGLLGATRPVAFEDSVAYFKIHLAERRTWVCARLQMDRRTPLLWVPMPVEQVTALAPGRVTSTIPGWTSVVVDSIAQMKDLEQLLIAAYGAVRESKTSLIAD